MGTTTPNMGLSKPTLAGDAGTWDDQNNATIDRIDIHTHAAGLGVPIPTAGILLNADLTFGGYAAINLKALSFATQASYNVAKSLWVKTSDSELYWRNASGTDVKLTSGTSLNLSLVGGITGDYAAASAALYYDDAAQTYRFLEAAPLPNSWSRVACGDVDLFEHASGITNRVRLSSPAGLAASYGITFPAALPGSTLLQQVSSAGVVTWSNTVTQSTTFSGGLATTGAANFSGASSISFPSRTLLLHPASGKTADASTTAAWSTGGAGSVLFSGAVSWDVPIPLYSGDRITAINVYYSRDSGTTLAAALHQVAVAGGAITVLCTKNIAAGAGSGNTEIGTSPTAGSLPQTLSTSFVYHLRFTASTNDDLYAVEVVCDRP